MTSETVPRLRVVTRRLDVAPDLISLAHASNPLLWLRDGRGCVGIGEALRLRFSGPSRFADAARTWRGIAAAAQIEDPVQRPGSGLTALGTIAFDDTSTSDSTLIVPSLLITTDGDEAWITETKVTNAIPDPAPTAHHSHASYMTDTHLIEAAKQACLPARHGAGGTTDVEIVGAAGEGGAQKTRWAGTEFAATELSLTAYLDGVSIAVRRIAEGSADKIVLARQVIGSIDEADDLRVPLQRLAERYTECHTFAVDGLVGASPETLIRGARGQVSARVLAGTRRRRNEDQERDFAERDELLASPKEQQEHAFAVQSVVTALSPHVRDLETSADPFALELPNVWHLATDLRAVLAEASSSLELAGALHPTAAVAGTPTRAAVGAIAELEPFDRGRYSGAVGWIDASGDGEWAIALRCAQVGPVVDGRRTVVASAGGGIVTGSDPEHELGETVSKFRPITEAFAA